MFDQDYHVLSVYLELHSNFFRKFLDSVEKEPAAAMAEFKYEYLSVIDSDGSWAFEPKLKVCRNGILKFYEKRQCFGIRQTLLCFG